MNVTRVQRTSSVGWKRVKAIPTFWDKRNYVTTVSNVTNHTETREEVSRHALLQEAGALTRSLYRRCLRSVKVIRWGNEFDELEFAKREEEFVNPQRRSHPGSISMAPPPNKEDELRSRAEYYRCYAREYFVQESDSLDNDPLKERDIRRYLYYLRKGEKDRKWLLGDMMFADPFKDAVDQVNIDKFEVMSKIYLGVDKDDDNDDDGRKALGNAHEPAIGDGFEVDEDPEWFQTKFPHLR
jgi:hypothetical protein